MRKQHQNRRGKPPHQSRKPEVAWFHRLWSWTGILGSLASIIALLIYFVPQATSSPSLFPSRELDIPKFKNVVSPTLEDIKPHIHPDSAKCLELFLQSTLKASRLRDVGLECLQTALELEQNNDTTIQSTLHTLLGRSLIQEGQFVKAIETLEMARTFDAHNVITIGLLYSACQKRLHELIQEASPTHPNLADIIREQKAMQRKLAELEILLAQQHRALTAFSPRSSPFPTLFIASTPGHPGALDKALLFPEHRRNGQGINVVNWASTWRDTTRDLLAVRSIAQFQVVTANTPHGWALAGAMGLRYADNAPNDAGRTFRHGRYKIARTSHSLPASPDIPTDQRPTPDVDPDQWVSNRMIAIGIDSYNRRVGERLDFALSDAKRVSDAFNQKGFRVQQIMNQDATRDQIMQRLIDEARQSQPGDIFVFYASGHGFSDRDGRRFLALYNAAGGQPTELLAIDEIDAIFQQHQGQVYVVLDTCFDQYDAVLASPTWSTPDNQDAGTKVTYLFGSALGERAIESPRLRSGLVTYALVEYLNQEPRENVQLDFPSLLQYTSRRTTMLAQDLYGLPQNPIVSFGDAG
jgi:hypothetical protein